MTKEELLESLEDFEEIEWIEYKTNYPANHFYHEIGEYISALSNAAAYCKTEQAYMIWGVDDKSKKIVGTNFNYNINVKGEPFKHYLSRMLHPKISFKFEEIEYKGKRIVLLTVPAAVLGPTDFDKVRYFRIGSSKVDIRDHFYDEKELWRILSGDDDITNIPATNQDLTFNFLESYLRAHGYHFTGETFDVNLQLRNSEGKYNLMAELLADKNNIVMNVNRFLTNDKTEFLNRKEFGYKCLLYAMEMAMGYVDTLNHTFVYVGSGVRQEKEMFDTKAFREAWINACVHFKWCDGQNPGVYVYSNRLEIESLGGIPKNLTRRQFLKGHSKPVNPKLFDIFKMCGFVEESGHGVPKVVEVYGEQAFDADGGTMNVVIPFSPNPFHPEDPINAMINYVPNNYPNTTQITTQKTTPITTQITTQKESRKNATEEVLNLIKTNPFLSRKDLSRALNMSEDGIKYHLTKLKKKNLIIHHGPAREGMWEVVSQLSLCDVKGSNDTINEPLNDTINEPLSALDIQIIEVIKANNSITKEEIANQVNKSLSAIKRHLVYLCEIKVIERQGSKKKGVWVVLKEKRNEI